MASAYAGRIIDSDGHIFEDLEAIKQALPLSWRSSAAWQGISPHRWLGPFPTLDHMHNFLAVTPPGGFKDPGGPDGWFKFMDDVGISSAVLYPTDALSYGRIVDDDVAIEVGRAYNDWLSETYVKASPRFQGMALIPMQDPDEAVAELRRAIEELGLCGAMLPATGLKAHLGSKEYWPVYQEADRLGCCLAVHGGCYSNLGFNDVNVFSIAHSMGHSLANTIGFTSMLFNGVFDKFPNARYGFLESGVGWFLMALERCDSSYKAFAPLDPRGKYLRLAAGESVADYIRRQCDEGRIAIGIEGDEPDLAYAIDLVGRKPFMYATDFPHEVNREIVQDGIDEIEQNEELNDGDKAAIFYLNAERFYGLQPVSTGA